MPETLLELGKALSVTGDSAGAGKAFRKVLEFEQTSKLAETAHYQLAQIYRKLGQPAEADREMKLFQQLRSKNK
jgi:Flp pilus assembly protein TadD